MRFHKNGDWKIHFTKPNPNINIILFGYKNNKT